MLQRRLHESLWLPSTSIHMWWDSCVCSCVLVSTIYTKNYSVFIAECELDCPPMHSLSLSSICAEISTLFCILIAVDNFSAQRVILTLSIVVRTESFSSFFLCCREELRVQWIGKIFILFLWCDHTSSFRNIFIAVVHTRVDSSNKYNREIGQSERVSVSTVKCCWGLGIKKMSWTLHTDVVACNIYNVKCWWTTRWCGAVWLLLKAKGRKFECKF